MTVADSELRIYQDVYTALAPIAPASGGNIKLFALQAPSVETAAWATPPYIVYRLQSDITSKGYRSDVMLSTLLAVSVVMSDPSDASALITAVRDQLHDRYVEYTTPQPYKLRYRWVGTQPLIGTVPYISVQLYRVLVG